MKVRSPKVKQVDAHARALQLPRIEAATSRGATYFLKQQATEDAGHMGYWKGAWLVFAGSIWGPLLHRAAMRQYEWCAARSGIELEALRVLLDMAPIFADQAYYEQRITDQSVVLHKPTPRAQLWLVSSLIEAPDV